MEVIEDLTAIRWMSLNPEGSEQGKHRNTAQDFRRENFSLVRKLISRIQTETTLKSEGTQRSRLLFKDTLIKAEEYTRK